MNAKKTDPANWRSATKLVRGGTARSPFGETSEGTDDGELFLEYRQSIFYCWQGDTQIADQFPIRIKRSNGASQHAKCIELRDHCFNRRVQGRRILGQAYAKCFVILLIRRWLA